MTANLRSRDIPATVAFYGRLGFEVAYRDDGWLILRSGDLEIEFFHFSDLDPGTNSFSACVRVNDLAAHYATFRAAGLSDDTSDISRRPCPGAARCRRCSRWSIRTVP